MSVEPIFVFIAGSDEKYFELTVQSIKFLYKNVPNAIAGVISTFGSGDLKAGIEDRLKELEPSLNVDNIKYIDGQRYFEDWNNTQHILDFGQFAEEFDPVIFVDSDSVILRDISPFIQKFMSSGKDYGLIPDFLNDYPHFQENWEDKNKLFIPQTTLMLFRSRVVPQLIPAWQDTWKEWIEPAPFVQHKDPARYYRLSKLCIGQYALGQTLFKVTKNFDKEVLKIPRNDLKLCRNLGVEVQRDKQKFLGAGSSYSNDSESKITINIISGKIYEKQDVGGKGDPYVTVVVNDWERKTKVIKDTQEPVWNETFVYEDTNYGDANSILLTLWDWDKLTKNDKIGTATLSLLDSKVTDEGELKHYSIPILNKDGEEKAILEIGAEFLVRQQDEDEFAAKMVRAIASLGSSLSKLEALEVKNAVINVVSANVLNSHEALGGKDDVFATVNVGGVEKKTKTINNNQQPVWNEEFTFPEVTDEAADDVTITLWDEDDISKHDQIGVGHLSLEPYKNNKQRTTVTIYNEKNGKEEGTVEIDALLEVNTKGYGAALDKDDSAAAKKARELITETNDEPAPPPQKQESAVVSRDFEPEPAAPIRTGTATFYVRDGKVLKSHDTFGKGDPYVMVNINSQSKKSTVKMNTQTPKWNERLIFENIPMTEDITAEISMWDKDDITNDDFIGKVVYPVGQNALDKKKVESALSLNDEKGKQAATVNIEIDLKE